MAGPASTRRITSAALVLGPALFLAGTVLHPEELSRGHEREQLAEIADAYTRWQAAHALGFAASLVLAAAVVGLAFLVGRGTPGVAANGGAPRSGLVGGALGIAGLIGLGAVLAIEGYTWGLLGQVSTFPSVDDRSIETALRSVQQSNWALLYYLTPVAFVLGVIVLAVAAVRQQLVPAWPAGVLALGALMTVTEAAIVENAYFIAGAAVLLAGGAATALSLASTAGEP